MSIWQQALKSADATTRLQAALVLGSTPSPDGLDLLIARSGVEEDFFVRGVPTWALTRFHKDLVIRKLVTDLDNHDAPFATS
ncbi:HEAT repeat domain-containing protein [Corynebacterium deserti]|uniref:HEAT repeat domain-containing protein n=1 Tax=Corynebacterium deserti TaxID=1408191 RepID=UPI0006AD590C|nr:HEAT repeat domain-containing protein [Corynebacterium deserti]